MIKKINSKAAGFALIALALATLAGCNTVTKHTVTFVIPSEVTGGETTTAQYAEMALFDLPSTIEGDYAHHAFSGWVDTNGKDYNPGASVTMGQSDLTFTAIFSINIVGETYCVADTSYVPSIYLNYASHAAPIYFDADYTWNSLSTSTLGDTSFNGTWSYGESGLSMTSLASSGNSTAVAVTDDGTDLNMSLMAGTYFKVALNSKISKYEFINNYNKEFGTSFAAPTTEPTYTVTYSSGNASATGADPQGSSYRRHGSFTLPENPYTYLYHSFKGWDVDGTTYQPGDSVEMEMADYAITPVWAKDQLLVADCNDTFFKMGEYAEGVALTYYCDGSVACNGYRGSWDLNGGVLETKNKEGNIIAIKANTAGTTFTFDIDTKDYYWGSTATNNMVNNHYTDTFTMADFVSAYNTEYSKTIASFTLASGTAVFD